MNKDIIKVNHLSFSYDKNNILENLNANIPANSITLILGLNGTGKSTFFKCLLKQEKISEGSIEIDDKPLDKMSFQDLATTLSFVPQLNQIVNIDCPVREFIVEGRTPYLKRFQTPSKKDYLIVEKYANKMNISHLLNKNVSNLSGGEAQLVSIARALVQETKIIIMDEPMSALDINNQYKIMDLMLSLQKEGKTIIFTSHNPNHAFILKCNVLILDNKQFIFAGEYDHISQQYIDQLFEGHVTLTNIDNELHCRFCSLAKEK